MSLTGRLVLIVSFCIAVSILGVSAILGVLARDSLIAQAESQARLVADLIADAANRAELSIAEAEGMVDAESVTLGLAAGQILQAATGNPAAMAQLSIRLAELAAQGAIDDIRILDGQGRSVAQSIVLPSNMTQLPVDLDGKVLGAVTSGQQLYVAVTVAPPQSYEERRRYVVVRAPEGHAVLVGRDMSYLDDLKHAVGQETTLQSIADQETIGAIRTFDDSLRQTSVIGASRSPDASELTLARAAIDTVRPVSHVAETGLWVASPILDAAGIATGAAVIQVSRDNLDKLVRDYVKLGSLAALAMFVFGAVAAAWFASRIVRPVNLLTNAATAFESRRFEPSVLDHAALGRDELGRLARVFQQMAIAVQAREEHLEALVRERTSDLAAKNALLEEAKQRMETELDIARSLQAAMLPQAMPAHESYNGTATMTPAREMCGDFYDFFAIDEHSIGLVIADVSGKGVPAAFFMAISRTVLQASARDHRSTGKCLAEVNDLLCDQNPMNLFVTVFYGILDARTGTLTYANAGHNPPLCIKRQGEIQALPLTDGVAIGVMPGLTYDEHVMQLSPGDTLFLYTDGISEAMDSDGREFTEERLRASLAQSHTASVHLILERVTGAVRDFVGSAPQSDDQTCVVLRYQGAAPVVGETVAS